MEAVSGQMPVKKRIHNRVPCHSMGEIVLTDGTHSVRLLDVSSGGCKIKLPDEYDPILLADALPVEFVLTIGSTSVPGGIIWYMADMFGCNFYDHILLDTIAQVMSGGFKIRLLPKSAANI